MGTNASATLTDFSAWLTGGNGNGHSNGNGHKGLNGGETESRGRLYGGLTVSERRAARRQRLLDAGLELFATKGYPSATIEGICAAAGVTARHFYEEFGSREELLRAVFDRAVDLTISEIAERLATTDKHPDDLDGLVREGVTVFMHAFLDDPRRARVCCIESVGVSADMEAHRRELFHRFSGLLQSEVERTGGSASTWPGDFTLATMALVGGTSEVVVDWLQAEEKVDIDVVAETVASLYLAVVHFS